MNLKKVLTKDSVLLALQADTKQGVIEELVTFLAATGKLTDSAAALRAVLDRETKMSTGMQHGIAIPHGKTDTVDELIVAIALKPVGVDFEAMDEKPSTLFVMTLSPTNRTGPHIQFLAEISKLLSQEKIRADLLTAQSEEEVLALLTS